MTIEQVIEQIVDEFTLVGDWEERYAHIISMGKVLAPYPDEFRADEFKVHGCTSQVWLHPRFDGERVKFDADSDAVIVKGLVALLMRIFHNRTPQEILSIDTSFVSRLGLDTHLSPSRANGLSSMLRDIRSYAIRYQGEIMARPPVQQAPADQTEQSTSTGAPASTSDVPSTTTAHHTTNGSGNGPLRDAVIDALHTVFDPEIPIDIYELGLIYEVRVAPDASVHVVMTLTTPNCPSAQSLPAEVHEVTRAVPGVKDCEVEITFDPPWDRTMMSEAALFSMGLF